MKFIFPCKAYEERAKEFIQEFHDYHSDINGSGALDSYLEKYTYDEWLKKVAADIDLPNVPNDRVPAYTYFYADDAGHIVGMINIRLQLNDFLLKEGGHIGYCIRPTERKKGYAVRMLEEALLFLRRIGLERVLLICDKANPASAGVIRHCGGKLENELYSEFFHETIQRYWIG